MESQLKSQQAKSQGRKKRKYNTNSIIRIRIRNVQDEEQEQEQENHGTRVGGGFLYVETQLSNNKRRIRIETHITIRRRKVVPRRATNPKIPVVVAHTSHTQYYYLSLIGPSVLCCW